MMRVEVADVTAELAVTWRPAARRDGAPYAGYELVPRDRARGVRRGGRPGRAACGPSRRCGSPAASPGSGLDTDHRTIPNEVGWIGTGRAPGQGLLPRPGDRRPRAHPRPAAAPADAAAPRRLREPAARRAGSELLLGEKAVGFVGTSARHHELGPIALALVKRNVAARRRSSRSTACPPPRRSWSTPRSACTSARCAEPSPDCAGFGTKPRTSAAERCGSCPLGDPPSRRRCAAVWRQGRATPSRTVCAVASVTGLAVGNLLPRRGWYVRVTRQG